jgi:hypothetical protein
MKPDDRIRVLAPVSGQVAAFAVVLVLGLLFGHHASSPRSVRATSKTPGQSVTLTVTAFKSDVSMAGYQVDVFNARSLRRVGQGNIDSFGYFSLRVRPGSYQVCLQIPAGYSTGSSKVLGNGHALAPLRPQAKTGLSSRSWECGRATADTGLMGMSFEFSKEAVR